jgi:dTDP-glucose 4,6-dehydratase
VRSFELPKEQFRYVIHAATEASAKMIEENPAAMLDTIVSGTRCVLQLTKNCGCAKLLFTSSGAVYGPQPAEILNAPETYLGAPDPLLPGSAYGIGKRVAEHLCVLQARESGCEAKIARCFAFVGPMLPLDTHFAIGNFLRDALAGRDITVAGDGTPYRSYLYASDLATWLWTILFRGPPCRAYNVGSDQPISIRELALIIQRLVGANSAVQIARQPAPGATPSRYVPSTHRASAELGLKHTVPIEEAILRTTAWIKSSNLLHPSAII